MTNFKNISSDRKTSSLLLILLYLTIFFAIPYLHNHEADLATHEDCPAHFLEINLIVTAIIVFYIFFIILPVFRTKLLFQSHIIYSVDCYTTFLKRAPPDIR
jgi:hypothetical protein